MFMHEVEFIGGPLDGHNYAFSHTPDDLPSLAKLSISADVVRVVTGEKNRVTEPASSTAVYCLDAENGTLRYYFVASIAAEEHQFDNA